MSSSKRIWIYIGIIFVLLIVIGALLFSPLLSNKKNTTDSTVAEQEEVEVEEPSLDFKSVDYSGAVKANTANPSESESNFIGTLITPFQWEIFDNDSDKYITLEFSNQTEGRVSAYLDTSSLTPFITKNFYYSVYDVSEDYQTGILVLEEKPDTLKINIEDELAPYSFFFDETEQAFKVTFIYDETRNFPEEMELVDGNGNSYIAYVHFNGT